MSSHWPGKDERQDRGARGRPERSSGQGSGGGQSRLVHPREKARSAGKAGRKEVGPDLRITPAGPHVGLPPLPSPHHSGHGSPGIRRVTYQNLIDNLRLEYQVSEGAQGRSSSDHPDHARLLISAGCRQGSGGWGCRPSGPLTEQSPSTGSESPGCLLMRQVNPSSESTAVTANKELLLVYMDCLFPLSINPHGTWIFLHFHCYQLQCLRGE